MYALVQILIIVSKTILQLLTIIFYISCIYIILTIICITDITKKCIFIVNYLLVYVLRKFLFKHLEDDDNAKTCRSNRKMHRFCNCAFVCVTKDLTYRLMFMQTTLGLSSALNRSYRYLNKLILGANLSF